MATLTREARLATDIECSQALPASSEEYDSADVPLEVADVLAHPYPDHASSVSMDVLISRHEQATLLAACSEERTA